MTDPIKPNKNSFFSVELVRLNELNHLIVNLYKEKNFGYIPVEIRKAYSLILKRKNKIAKILNKKDTK